MNDKLERIDNINAPPELHYSLPPENQSYMREPEANFQIHLLDYWKVLVKRWWIVCATLVIFVSVSSYITYRQPQIYRASLKLQIDNEQANIFPFRDATASFTYVTTEEYLKTQFEALTSRTLATRVIHAMDLENDTRFSRPMKLDAIDRFVRRVRTSINWRFYHGQKDKSSSSNTKYPSPYSSLADSLLSSITITPIKNSSVVIISFDAQDPVLAADIVNTLAAEYIQMNFETKYKSTKMASDFLAKQLIDIKKQVEQSEERLVRFGQAHNIYTLGAKENVIMQKLSDLNAALTQAQAERIQKESIWRIASKYTQGQLPESISTNDIKSLESTVATLQQQYSKLRAVYKPDWWEVKQVAGQLETAEKQLAKLRNERIRDLGTAYQTAQQREKLLMDAVIMQKQEADTLNEYSIQYNILKQDVDSNKQIYDGMLQRMKEAGITAGLKSNNIHVVDSAIPPGAPILPNKNGNLTKALLSGLVFGIALAFFFEYVGSYFDRSLKTPEDVDRFVKLPFLGLIPSTHSFEHAGARKSLALNIRARDSVIGRNGNNGQSSIELITLINSKSLISEAYRHLRTSILLSSNGHNRYKSIVVTSSKHGEGKTSTCINLAVTLAQANKKVLLMDCDLRNPKIHHILGLKNQEGVSTFLSECSDPLNHLIRETSIPNLYVLTSGQIPPNPSELVGSPLMKRCLGVLSQRFDHILVDTPPLLAVTDGSILANLVDGVILVISGGDTPKEAIMRSKHLLACAQARIIGAMLNNVDLNTCEPNYYSRYFYGYDIDNTQDTGSSDTSYASSGKQGQPS